MGVFECLTLAPGENSSAHSLLRYSPLGAVGVVARLPPPPALDGDESQVLTVTIRNERLNVARVSLWINGVRRRLGDVRGLQTETFDVPMQRSQPVRMSFDLELGVSCVTQDIVLGPGEEIETRIPVNLNTMAAVCRGR